MITTDSPLLTFLGFAPTGDLGGLTGYTSKRRRPVWYLKAPPKTPPTCWQLHQRNRWRVYGWAWTSLTEQQRSNWTRAAQLARLKISGINLFFWYQHTHDRAVIRTVEHQSGVNLI